MSDFNPGAFDRLLALRESWLDMVWSDEPVHSESLDLVEAQLYELDSVRWLNVLEVENV